MLYVPCLLLPLVVSLLAWCRRRNVGVLTWMLRIAPIAAVFTCPVSLGAIWLVGLYYMTLLRKSMPLAVIMLIPLIAICVMIVRWRGLRVNAPRNRWSGIAFMFIIIVFYWLWFWIYILVLMWFNIFHC